MIDWLKNDLEQLRVFTMMTNGGVIKLYVTFDNSKANQKIIIQTALINSNFVCQ